jgi:hypothetical protein
MIGLCKLSPKTAQKIDLWALLSKFNILFSFDDRIILKFKTPKMISNEKVINTKVIELIEIYNYYFGHLRIQLYLNNLNFEFQKMTTRCKVFEY